MKSKLLVVLLCYLSWLGTTQAAERYISDNVHTFMHAGPSNKFRIIGSITAGEAVTQLDRDAQSKYVQIRDVDGRVGWVEGQFVQSKESFRYQLHTLEENLQDLKLELSSVDERHEQNMLETTTTLQNKEQELDSVQTELAQLRTEYAELTAENQRLSSLMDDKEHQMRLDWLLNGGIVAGIGILLGFLLPLIPLRRKRSTERWMD